jgi:Fic family protein
VRIESFTDAAWGRLTRTAAGNPAFVPAPAPRQLPLSTDVIDLLDEASHRLGILIGVGRRLPNPHLLIGPYLRREAVQSSRIEGTQTTIAELYAAEAEQLQLVSAGDVHEVVNYVEAYQFGLDRLNSLPLSLRLIKELHGRLLAGVRGRGSQPGEFRTYQNFVGGTSEVSAAYVGPPVPEMHECLNDFERFLHDRSLRPLVQAAVLHYQFEAIHPFGDGNGRVGRLLIGVFLAERGVLPRPLLYLSAFFERTRTEYYDRLLGISTAGNWDAWLTYFLEGVRQQADEAARFADELLALQARYRETLQRTRASANALRLLDSLFVNPIVTTSRAAEILDVTAPTARAAIRLLEENGVLHEVSGRRWGRVYAADELLRLVRTDETGIS